MQAYRQLLAKAFNKQVDFDTDTLVFRLYAAAGYTPNLDTHILTSDLGTELSTGGGYTNGGQAIVSPTMTYTAANSWGVSAATTTAYVVGQVVRPSTGNGWLYRCVVAGTSGGSAPTWPTVLGTTVTDGTVTWEAVGKGIVTLKCTSPSWSSATFTARYCVLVDTTASILLGLDDFGSDRTGGGGAFTINVDANLGVLYWFQP